MGVLFLFAILGVYTASILSILFFASTVGAIVANKDLWPSISCGCVRDPGPGTARLGLPGRRRKRPFWAKTWTEKAARRHRGVRFRSSFSRLNS